ncbi:hypothetical protein P691DRAFT_805215 [Macrolepiota fuliginosa MF-IS2]|uniref:[histone H3]-trimethyl-L-lysine(9) demethylase n=1 Tax=Macrolepiota fuliginosa MF-IS2 TaxID=1400762 RepID=A0A9P6C1R1_9AGAR|nr:hypothetical protein P691DRAFT_805215 [Macrolepiota fuliginosa MF-IS2]
MSRLPSLTPSRSVSPPPPVVQPDHFYKSQNSQAPPSPNSDRRTWLTPEDDPLAERGIPVFKPSMAEFEDFEEYMKSIECWGMRSGIVKVIPPKEWTEALPSIIPQLRDVQISRPIEQHMLGHGGLFRQENLEKRKFMSVREWVELCGKEEFRAPGVHDVGSRLRRGNGNAPAGRTRKTRKKGGTVVAEPTGPDAVTVKEEPMDDSHHLGEISSSVPVALTPPSSVAAADSPKESARQKTQRGGTAVPAGEKPRTRGRRNQTKEQKEANHARDVAFVDSFDPPKDWLPSDTKPSDYTVDFCQELERTYWRNLGLGKPAWYGADTQGSLFTEKTKSWNVAHLPSTLSRILPTSDKGLPGVNTPYLYFGMWRATFAWHVEDMDLFSINYIHFGAPKFWYAIPQGRSYALEQTMRGYFPKDTSTCPQFLRHKSFLASPNILAQSSCRPNTLVQHAGEFVITFPRGYHAGLNLGLNCAESVNFALDSWIELGRKAKACKCIEDSVIIDVDQLLQDRALEAQEAAYAPPTPVSNARNSTRPTRTAKPRVIVKGEHFDPVAIPSAPSKISRKRKSEGGEEPIKLKKIKIRPSSVKNSVSASSTASTSAPALAHKHLPPKLPASVPKISVTLKLPPRPTEPEAFPCCLCISQSRGELLRVYDPPIGRKDAIEAAGHPKVWLAHEQCAKVVPETWVDELDVNGVRERMVFGVDGIVKDRWNLKCSSCTRSKPKSHGAPVQCTKGKCPKAFHVSCARDSPAILFEVVKEVEKEVILMDQAPVSMEVDFAAGFPVEKNDQVLKVINKLEVQILCIQHNPAVAAEKKANKQDKIKKELLALPTMSRIKIRVSAGVFEVSLVRVIEETGSVEVLWDRGLKKEFKWGSVVFGSTDGPVHQKPSEPAPEPEVPQSIPPGSYLSVPLRTPTTQPTPTTSSTPVQAIANTTTSHPSTSYSVPYYPQRTGYNYWPYGTSQTPYSGYSYPYGGYYANVPMNGTTQYTPFVYNQQYRGGQLQWQQPYQGPRQGVPTSAPGQQTADANNSQAVGASPSQVMDAPTSDTQDQTSNGIPVTTVQTTDRGQTQTADPTTQSQSPTDSTSEASLTITPTPSVTSTSNGSTPVVLTPEQSTSPLLTSIAPNISNPTLSSLSGQSLSVPMDNSQSFTLTTEMEQAILRNLQALSVMQPTQLAELLQSNPQLQTVLAAVNQTKPSAS